jgi:transcription initiation factor IIE alpha subunit
MFANASSNKYTLPNIEDIEQETGINRKTITKYIKLLMDNELVYYETMRKATDKTKNVYGRWENRDIVKKFAEENLDY